jgi:hypothetical protein
MCEVAGFIFTKEKKRKKLKIPMRSSETVFLKRMNNVMAKRMNNVMAKRMNNVMAKSMDNAMVKSKLEKREKR